MHRPFADHGDSQHRGNTGCRRSVKRVAKVITGAADDMIGIAEYGRE
jgi:hypothetical protein